MKMFQNYKSKKTLKRELLKLQTELDREQTEKIRMYADVRRLPTIQKKIERAVFSQDFSPNEFVHRPNDSIKNEVIRGLIEVIKPYIYIQSQPVPNALYTRVIASITVVKGDQPDVEK